MKSKIIMSIHDAINLKVWDPEQDMVQDIIKRHMEKVLTRTGVEVPILADIKIGKRWEELQGE